MSKRGKASARAVSPDIVSLSTIRRTPARKKNQKDERNEVEPLESEDVSKTPGDVDQADVDCDTKTEVEIVTIQQKKPRGRKKRGPKAKAKTLTISPDIDSITNSRAGNNKRGRGKPRQLLLSETIPEPELELAAVFEESLEVSSPIAPCVSPDVTGESLDIKMEISATIVPEEMDCSLGTIPVEVPPTAINVDADQTGEINGEILEETKEDEKSSASDRTDVQTPEDSSFLGTSDIFGRKYNPDIIPGLDIEPGEENAPKVDSNSFSFGSVMAKTLLSSEKNKEKEFDGINEEKYDDADNKIRRSSRIKSLEESRGPRSRRREVVFSSAECLSTTSSRSQSVAGDDDSNSNSNSVEISSVPLVETPRSNSPSDDSVTKTQSDSTLTTAIGPPNCASLTFTNILNSTTNGATNGSLKPLKVKSRWRYSLDAESLKLADLDSEPITNPASEEAKELPAVEEIPKTPSPPPRQVTLVKKPGFIIHDAEDDELIDKLKKFDGIEESIFFTERKISKESKHMICDCYLSKEDINRGEIGCNEDCLNRLLMVECGTRCPTGDKCTNRKFQRKEYCKLEVFKTDKKGHGLRTLETVPAGGFVIEYVGEVLNPRGFAIRTKEYAKEKQEHFYFMALRSDTIIDATQKGNCSRFINHSCEPNCETQKWTVNGELRIGFFTLRDLEPGEEITFDYQFQRYGKKAQKCFCQSERCRGWIGGDEEEDEEEDLENKEPEIIDDYELTEITERKVKPKSSRRKKKQAASSVNEFGDRFAEELAFLEKTGLKNRNQTLMLCRLMVRAEDWDARERLLHILANGDHPCRRLFLDYHGLRLIHGWMSTLPLPQPENALMTNDLYHLLFLKALGSLPIPNLTLLKDSHMLALVEKWSEITVVKNVPDLDKEPTTESNEAAGETEVSPPLVQDVTPIETEPAKPAEEPAKPDQKESDQPEIKQEENTVAEMDSSASESVDKVSDATTVQEESNRETIAVPKVEIKEEKTQEEIKFDFIEGAKQLLQDWADLKEVFRIPKKERVEQMKEHEREADKGDTNATKESKENGYDREGRSSKLGRKDRFQHLDSFLPYNRKMRDFVHQYSNLSKEERRLIFAKQAAEQEKETQKQRQMQDEMVLLHQERCKLLNLDASTTPIVDPSGVYYLDPKTITWKEIDPEDPSIPPELLLLVQAAMNPPLPERLLQLPLASQEEPAEPSFPPWPEGFPPPPPLPSITLPPFWEMVPDEDGRFYYFHRRTRNVRWVIPSPESSDTSDLSSNDSSHSDEESDDGEPLDIDDSAEAAQEEDLERVSKSLERREKRKLSGLVQERIISPRSEDDKPLLSHKAIRARKLELMNEKKRGIKPDDIDDEPTEIKETPEAVIVEVQEPQVQSPVEASEEPAAVEDPISPMCSVEKKRKLSVVVDHEETESIDPQQQVDEEEEKPLEAENEEQENPVVKRVNETESVSSVVSSEPVPMETNEAPAVETTPVKTKPSSSKSSEKKRGHKKNKNAKKSTDKNEAARKLKERKSSEEYFRNQIANVIVQNLNPYRKSSCKNGRITSTEHFKHLARKLTHMVTTKEVKHCKNAKTLVVNDSVKHKTKEFVKKYMGRFHGRDYEPSPQDN